MDLAVLTSYNNNCGPMSYKTLFVPQLHFFCQNMRITSLHCSLHQGENKVGRWKDVRRKQASYGCCVSHSSSWCAFNEPTIVSRFFFLFFFFFCFLFLFLFLSILLILFFFFDACKSAFWVLCMHKLQLMEMLTNVLNRDSEGVIWEKFTFNLSKHWE